MKWIGQHIWSLISRFRNDIYLEDVSSGTIASGGNLGLDSNNKIVKATETTGDITSVVAGVGLSGGATSGDATLTVDLSEFSGVTPANGDSLATLDSDGSTEQLTTVANLATLFAGTGLTASSSVIGVDAAQSGITSLGTLTGLTIDGNKSVTPGDGAMIHVDQSDITDGNTSEEGTVAAYTHVNIEAPRLLATNANVTTTNAATLYIDGPIAAHTNQTITNTWALWVDSGNARFDGNIDLEGDMDINGTLETDALTIGGATVAAIGTSSITTLGTIGTGVWQGTAIAHAYIGADAIEGDNLADNAVDSEHYTDGSIDTAHIADDQVTFAKASGVTPNVFGSVIKLLPTDFMDNGDGGNTKFGIGYTDSAGTGYGMRVPNGATEMYAFVSIPEGMKATHVDIFDKTNLAIEVYEVQINATTMVSKGTGNCNTTLDITDVNASATNMLAIEVTTTATSDRVYGGTVTIAAQ